MTNETREIPEAILGEFVTDPAEAMELVTEYTRKGGVTFGFTEHIYSWVSSLVVKNTNDLINPLPLPHEMYSHAMPTFDDKKRKEVRFASQGLRLRSVPLSDFFNEVHRVKIWLVPATFPFNASRAAAYVNKEVDKFFLRTIYDWPGIIGHKLGIPWLNHPLRRYCSEWTLDVAKEKLRPYNTQLHHPSPMRMNEYFKARTQPIKSSTMADRLAWPPNMPSAVLLRYDPLLDVDALKCHGECVIMSKKGEIRYVVTA